MVVVGGGQPLGAGFAAARMAASVGPGTRTKTKKKHFVPQRVKVLRSADPLLGVLAWGINHQVNRLRPMIVGLGGGGEYRAAHLFCWAASLHSIP